jgi:hypothetical protein
MTECQHPGHAECYQVVVSGEVDEQAAWIPFFDRNPVDDVRRLAGRPELLDRLVHLLVDNGHPMLSQFFRCGPGSDRYGTDIPDLARIEEGNTGELGIMVPRQVDGALNGGDTAGRTRQRHKDSL